MSEKARKITGELAETVFLGHTAALFKVETAILPPLTR